MFRFFVDASGTPGARVELAPVDAAHLRVLRLRAGSELEVIDGDGALWFARVDGEGVVLVEMRSESSSEPLIELVAGALVGGRFDELVDGAVQAGATRIIPLALSAADAHRLGARRDRLQRIARSAAKQAKRATVPEVDAPILAQALLDGPPGVIVDAGAPLALDDAVDVWTLEGAPLRLLVGSAAGLDHALVEQLVDRGWARGRLGPSILRAELAAAVAVAIAAMHAPRE